MERFRADHYNTKNPERPLEFPPAVSANRTKSSLRLRDGTMIRTNLAVDVILLALSGAAVL
jgi:hypothetical protein